MTEPLATSLEFGPRTVIRPCGETVRPGEIAKPGFCLQDLQHPQGIILPVGCEFENPSLIKTRANQGHEVSLYDATLVVAFLRPGIGEVEQDSMEGMGCDTGSEDIHRIPANDAHIGNTATGQLMDKPPKTRLVYLDTQIIVLGMSHGHFHQPIAHPEADLEITRCASSEDGAKIQVMVLGIHAEPLPAGSERLPLGVRNAPRPTHEAAHLAMPSGTGCFFVESIQGLLPIWPGFPMRLDSFPDVPPSRE